jgi:hypothetical protein
MMPMESDPNGGIPFTNVLADMRLCNLMIAATP